MIDNGDGKVPINPNNDHTNYECSTVTLALDFLYCSGTCGQTREKHRQHIFSNGNDDIGMILLNVYQAAINHLVTNKTTINNFRETRDTYLYFESDSGV